MTIDEYSEILKKCNCQEIDSFKTNHICRISDKYDLFFILDENPRGFLVNCYLRNNYDKVPEKIKIVNLCLSKNIENERLLYVINKTIDYIRDLYYNSKMVKCDKEFKTMKRKINLE